MERIGLVNLDTGEVLVERTLFIGKNPRYLDRGYVKVFTAFLSDIIETDKIAGKAIRLLLYMLENLDYNTLEIKIIRQEAIERLNIDPATYHRWIKDLVDFGIIEKKNRYTYVLKPYTFVKGSSVKAYENYLDKSKNKSKNKGGEKNG